jgi:hypothetical protein
MSKARQHARRRPICLDDDDGEQPVVAVVDEPPEGHSASAFLRLRSGHRQREDRKQQAIYLGAVNAIPLIAGRRRALEMLADSGLNGATEALLAVHGITAAYSRCQASGAIDNGGRRPPRNPVARTLREKRISANIGGRFPRRRSMASAACTKSEVCVPHPQ